MLREGDPLPDLGLTPPENLAALARFHSGLAHDLNNRLTTVLGNLCLLEELLPGEPEMLRDMTVAAEEAVHLVQLMQQHSRVEPWPAGPVEVGAVLRRLHDLLSRLLDRPLVCTLPDLPCYILAQEDALSQLLIRVIAAAGQGTESLTLAADEHWVWVQAAGGGAPDQLPASARPLLEAFGGKWQPDTEGWRLGFPQVTLEGLEPPEIPADAGRGQRVLLGMASPQTGGLVRTWLSDAGAEVCWVRDVPELREALAAGKAYHLALLETTLPGDGRLRLIEDGIVPDPVVWILWQPGQSLPPGTPSLQAPLHPAAILGCLGGKA